MIIDLLHKLFNVGMNNLRSSQAFVGSMRHLLSKYLLLTSWKLSTNDFADKAEELFEHDWDLENEYHTMLDGMSFRVVYEFKW